MLVNYTANIDQQATYDKMLASKVMTADMTKKGILSANFFGTKTVFMISPKGNLQVNWHNISEKTILLECLKDVLVAKEGQNLEIKPKNQVTKVNYDDDQFSLYWCAEKKEYFEKPEITFDGEEPVIIESGIDWCNTSEPKEGAINSMLGRGFRYVGNDLWVAKSREAGVKRMGFIYSEDNGAYPLKFEKYFGSFIILKNRIWYYFNTKIRR